MKKIVLLGLALIGAGYTAFTYTQDAKGHPLQIKNGILTLTDGKFNKKVNEELLNLSARELAEVQRFDLSRNNLKYIPSIIEDMKNLEELNLSVNNLQSIEMIPTLSGLKTLNLQHNDIDSLHGMKNQEALETLNLSDNMLTGLKLLPNLPKLKTLNINHNSLQKAPQIKGTKNRETTTAAVAVVALQDKDVHVIYEEKSGINPGAVGFLYRISH